MPARPKLCFAAALVVLGLAASAARADFFEFAGNFTADDNVQLFHFTVGQTSDVTLRTWSYAGGVNAAGQTIAAGGFDPILALFDSAGVKINQNDDGGNNVPADAVTGAHFDTFLTSTLQPGTYTVSVMEYNNFANGPNLSDGFTRAGTGNFTTAFGGAGATGPYWDVTRHQRDSHWQFEVLNVGSAQEVGGGVPEPSSVVLLGAGLVGMAVVTYKRRRGHADVVAS